MIDFPQPHFQDDIYLHETKEWGLSLISEYLKTSQPSVIQSLNIDENYNLLYQSSPENMINCIEGVINTLSNCPSTISDATNQFRLQFLFLLLKIKHALHPLSQLSQQFVRRWDVASRTPQKKPSANFRKTPTKGSNDNKIIFGSPTKDDKPICRICECPISQPMFTSHINQCLKCHSMKVEWQQINQTILSTTPPQFKDEIQKIVEGSMFTSALSHFLSSQYINKMAEKSDKYAKIPEQLAELIIRRDKLMIEGTNQAKLAVESISSDDSPNITDGYAMPPLPPPRLFDFEVISPISRGAFGSVFLCRRKQTNDIYALKAILADDYPTKNEVLDTEREVMCRASNPSVVSLYWSFRASGTIFFVMSFARGGDLFALLESVGSLEEETAIFYVAELIHAIEYLHSLGVVHCDLKPDNILISDSGHLQLTDFGLSKFGAEQRELNRTLLFRFAQSPSIIERDIISDISPKKRGIVGTPHYIAPESLIKNDYSPAVDWWAVGTIAYELVVGQPPFVGDSEAQVFTSIAAGKYEWPSDLTISNDYKKFVGDLLQLDPKRRPDAISQKKYEIFKNIDFDHLYNEEAPFTPDLQNATDLSYFENTRNSQNVSLEDFEELKAAVHSREMPDEWCCTNIGALAEKNKEVLSNLGLIQTS